MNLMIDEMNLIRGTRNEINRSSFSSLSDILHHCPNLNDFSISRTLLYDFGDGIQKNQVYEEVVFRDLMFGPLFLPRLSCCVSYISEMSILGDCRFADRPTSSHMLRGDDITYIDIHMPDTKFDSITYVRHYTGDFYLVLQKTEADQTVWHYEKNGHVKKYQSLLEPPSSNIDKHILCISIKCVYVDEIIIRTDDGEHYIIL